VLGLVRVAVALICLQLLIAAGMVEMHLPPVMRSLHEADGIAIWLTLFTLAWVARFSNASGAPASVRDASPAAASRVTPGTARGATT
jgi:heme A synthase